MLAVYGARCTWWDTIDKTANTDPTGRRLGIPCCPHCGGVLFQMDSVEKLLEGIPAHEAKGHPGYGERFLWARGKCFPTEKAMNDAYTAETGIVVP